ncbi:prepilin-type N-terminal cleavage/methylation domain-containing protein [Rickettsiales bacterium]|nr:prepilin-type N-terminal cleavage/methylation domain-containing protein [Rickettsiales bacterium]
MRNQGFTLVELSIVIVLIGMIIAGIVAGQDLVKQAKLKSIINEINKYETAINTFTLKYDAVPGDMPNAYNYWGANCDASADNCNGNYDGFVFWVATAGQTSNLEDLRAWQHLSLSGFISGSYIGVHQSSDFIGVTVPKAPIDGGCVSYLETGNISSPTATGRFKMPRNGLYLGRASINSDWVGRICGQPLFLPTQAYSIDIKMDDALPNNGKMQVRTVETTGCVGANNAADISSSQSDSYNLDNDAITCNLIYQTQ